MPATWNDLSNEIRKIIIEYVVADKTVNFLPRHAATRRARKEDEANAQEPAHFPLLLVSKQFLTYAELNDAVLKNATIKYQDARDLNALDGRFGKGSIENIRSLCLDLSLSLDEGSRPKVGQLKIPSRFQSRLRRMQKITVKYTWDAVWVGNDLSLADLIQVAKGHRVLARLSGYHDDDLISTWPSTITMERAKKHLRNIMNLLLRGYVGDLLRWFVKILVTTPEERFERVVQFDVFGFDPLSFERFLEV